MGLLNLKFLSKKENSQTTYLSLALTSDTISACVWELNDEVINQIGFSQKNFNSIDSLIHEAAVAIDDAAQKAQADVSQVVFGLSTYWLENGSLSKETSNILKNLSDDLDLEPQAFVSISSSINHYLKIKEDRVSEAVLVGIYKTFTEIHLIQDNKITVTKVHKGESDTEKIKQLFHQLKTDSQTLLPASIFVFGSKDESHLTKHLKHLDTDATFKSEPKIHFLDNEELVKCVVYSQAADVLGHDPFLATSNKTIVPAASPSDEQAVNTDEIKAEDEDTGTTEADKFGFVEDKDILEESQLTEAQTNDTNDSSDRHFDKQYAVDVEQKSDTTSQEEYKSPKEILEESDKKQKKNLIETFLTLGYVTKLTHFVGAGTSSKKIILAFGVLTILFAVAIFLLNQTLTSAKVIIKSTSTPYEEDFSVTVAKGATLDTARSRIPGDEVTATVSDKKSKQVTGKKKTGNNAKGEIKVFNWTTSEFTFNKGTVILSKSGVKFELDAEIQVASRSAALPGEANVNVTAQSFGTNGNLPSGSEFTFQQYDELLYSAKSNNDFTGGDEKEMTVVSQKDLDDLETQLEEELTQKALSDFKNQNSNNEISEDSISIVISKKIFDKKVDDEASQINLEMEIQAKALTYKEDILKDLLSQITQEAEQDLESRPENLDILTIIQTINKNALTLTGRYRANLVPKINEEELKSNIAGKSQKDARDIIKNIAKASEVEFTISPNLIFFTNLPSNISKINIETEAIR